MFREVSLPEMDGAEFTMLHSLGKNSKWMFVFNLLFIRVCLISFSIYMYISKNHIFLIKQLMLFFQGNGFIGNRKGYFFHNFLQFALHVFLQRNFPTGLFGWPWFFPVLYEIHAI